MLSPLVAAGILYLIITVPLTHAVNYIDRRLRTGRRPGRDADVAEEPTLPTEGFVPAAGEGR